MEILSISIDKEALRQLENVQRRLGFKSRSKMLRGAVLGMLKEYEALDSLRGAVESVFILTYNESEKNNVSDMLHKFEDSIKTELHQHNSGTCIDVLNIHTDAAKVRGIFSALKKSKSIYSLSYVIVRGGGKR